MTRLGTLGYSQRLLMDHSGEYDNFLQSMRDKAGVTATLDKGKYPTRYMGFDDEEIADSLAVLRHWQRTQVKAKAGRTATLINFIALHDGNRLPGRGRAEPFKPRAQEMFDNIRTFLRELERSGRKTMVVIVPEHRRSRPRGQDSGAAPARHPDHAHFPRAGHGEVHGPQGTAQRTDPRYGQH